MDTAAPPVPPPQAPPLLRALTPPRFDVPDDERWLAYLEEHGYVVIRSACGKEETAGADSFHQLVKDLTLQIAAAAPAGISREDIAPELVEAEKDLFRKQLAESGKPPEILEKIIEGKLGKFYSNICLLEQGFIKDPDQSIGDLLASGGKALDDELTVRRFTRFGVGED